MQNLTDDDIENLRSIMVTSAKWAPALGLPGLGELFDALATVLADERRRRHESPETPPPSETTVAAYNRLSNRELVIATALFGRCVNSYQQAGASGMAYFCGVVLATLDRQTHLRVSGEIDISDN
jgi:hypothetical protein